MRGDTKQRRLNGDDSLLDDEADQLVPSHERELHRLHSAWQRTRPGTREAVEAAQALRRYLSPDVPAALAVHCMEFINDYRD